MRMHSEQIAIEYEGPRDFHRGAQLHSGRLEAAVFRTRTVDRSVGMSAARISPVEAPLVSAVQSAFHVKRVRRLRTVLLEEGSDCFREWVYDNASA